MKKISFAQFITDNFNSGNFIEMANLIDLLNINRLEHSIIRTIAISCYKIKKHDKCIELIEFLTIQNSADYYLYELLADCYYAINDIDASLVAYETALKLNPKLIAAKFKYTVLYYRKTKHIEPAALDKIESIAQSRNNMTWLRIVSYIQYSQKQYDRALNNLLTFIESDAKVYSIDYFTVSKIYKLLGHNNEELRYRLLYRQTTFFYDFHPEGRSNLLITLSPSSSFILKKYPYSADRLNIIDNSFSYYFLSFELITDYICKLVGDYKYSKLSIVGSSKAATGVILLLNKLQEILPDMTITAVACSPQITIYPFNTNLQIPSYQNMMELVQINSSLEKYFHKNQNSIQFNIKNPNTLHIFYGGKFKMDSMEVSKIKSNSSSVQIIKLDYSGHGSLLPLTIPENKTLDDLKKTYAKLDVDADFNALGGNNLVSIVDEIFTIYQNPTMKLKNFL